MRELNPFSYAFHEDPYPTYRWLRDEHPVYRNERLGFWALSRYHDVVEASRDWAVYSSAEGTTLERLDPRLGEYLPMMIFMDPPRQTRLRSLVSKVFTPRRVAALEPFVRERARHHLDRLAAAGGDFVRECSALLPMDVIFTLLGVPAGDRDRMRGLMDASLHRDPDTPAIPPSAVDAMAQQGRYWFELVAARRRRPEDDLVSQLIAAELPADDGTLERLTDAEVAGFLNLLGAAGNETVTKLLANAIVLFARHPGEYAKILGDSARIPGAVEEVLRYTSPSQYQGRTLMRDVTLHGTTMPAGDRVLLLTASANRDERAYDDPDRFDVERAQLVPLGFGYGVHSCLGAALARLESRVALEEFTQRFPRYAIDEARLERVHMSNVHGFSGVPFRAVSG
jgi:cytochrome P450